MRIIFFLFFLFFNYIFPFPELDNIDKSKAIWKNAKIFYVHQYQLDVGFGRVNDYLCLFRSTEYRNFSNLEDGVGYKVILDNNACQNAEVNRPWIVTSKQASTDSDLIMELTMPHETADARLKLILKEETSAANPYGQVTLDYNYVLVPNSNPLYNASYKSVKLSESQIKFESSVFIDGIIMDNTKPLGEEKHFYSSKILHTPNSGGYGSVTSLIFNINPIWNASTGTVPSQRTYPDGVPLTVSTTNLVYNDNVVKYEIINGHGGQKNGVWLESGPNGGGSFLQSELCVSKTDRWSYIPVYGYGVYDEDGNRLGADANGDGNPSTGLSMNYSVTTNNILYSGQVIVFSGSLIGTGIQCKKMKDGSIYGNSFCPGTGIGDYQTVVRINGENYQNFPLFDIPEGTVLTDGGGNEYYIRQLGPRTVYSDLPLSNSDCNSLTLKNTIDTPDHTFFNYPIINFPKSGAILLNKFSSRQSFDSHSSGIFYSKMDDADGDGVANYLDAFPTDPFKSKDDDYDGVDDLSDPDLTPFQQTWEKYLNKSLYSSYSK